MFLLTSCLKKIGGLEGMTNNQACTLREARMGGIEWERTAKRILQQIN